MQGHGPNFKDEKDEFEFSKGKNNNNNLNQKTESGKISEEIESEGPFWLNIINKIIRRNKKFYFCLN